MAIQLVVAIQLSTDLLKAAGIEPGLEQRRQCFHQLGSIQPVIEDTTLTDAIRLRLKVAITAELIPVVPQVAKKIVEATGIGRLVAQRNLDGCIQGCIGRISQMKLVVPEREKPFAGMAGDHQPQGMGIGKQPLRLRGRQLSQGGEAVEIGAMNGQGRTRFPRHGQSQGIAAISDHRQPLQQG